VVFLATAQYDAIIIGAGHNGLLCGAYLAKSGLSVAIFEKQHEPGGGLHTLEIAAPGFLHNVHSNFHTYNPWAPAFIDLELGKYGLRYVYPEVQHALPLKNGKCCLVYREEFHKNTYKNFSKFSKKDADTWLKWIEATRSFRDEFLWKFQYTPPHELDADPNDITRKMVEERIPFWHSSYASMSAQDVLKEIFEDDVIRAYFCYYMSILDFDTDIKGLGGMVPQLFTLDRYLGLAVGGSHQLAHAQSAALHRYGGILFEGETVEKIIIKNNRATGVTLANGKEVEARKVVVSGLVPHLNLKLIGEDNLDNDLVQKLKNFKFRKACLVGIHFATNEAPKFTCADSDPDVNKAWDINIWGETPELIALQHQTCREGKLPWGDAGFINCWTNTLYDETQAPPGKHSLNIWLYVPTTQYFDPEKFDEIKVELANEAIDHWASYAPNIRKEGNIIGIGIYTPHDIELRNPNMPYGDWAEGDTIPEQIGFKRPIPEMGHYKAPFENLYLCGPSTHPKGSIRFSNGYLAFRTIAKDLGIKQWWTNGPIFDIPCSVPPRQL
jgi:phytoene dehydrogenase-like protein